MEGNEKMEDEEFIEEEDEGMYCDYGVDEFCVDPQTKSMGLCTTECKAYLDLCRKEANE